MDGTVVTVFRRYGVPEGYDVMADSVKQRVRAPAKLNLSLRVRGRRDDGYHLLSMRNVYIDLADEMEIELRDGEPGIAVTLEGPTAGFTVGLHGEDLTDPLVNTVARAYHFYQSRWPVQCGCRVHIKKRIPIGSGLGGGSSNAAALLWVFSRCFLKDDVAYLSLVTESVTIGADVPFFLFGRAAIVDGIGEKLSRFSFPGLEGGELYLVLPKEGSSTREVFEQFATHPRYYRKLFRPITTWEELMPEVGNDLERVIVARSPELGLLLEALRSIPDTVVSFSGSGSSLMVFSKNRSFEDTQRYRVIAEATQRGAEVVPTKMRVQIPR